MIVVVDYGMGNLNSVTKALRKLNKEHRVSGDPRAIEEGSHIIIPGVGHFKQGMENLEREGLVEAIKKAAKEDKKPVLGICLGMQLLFESSEEGGKTPGIGLLKGEVKRFRTEGNDLKTPHIGWNDVTYGLESMRLFSGIEEHSDFYFIHSYHATGNHQAKRGMTNHGYDFIAAVEEDNVFGTQFHPEKSQKRGLQVLRNFAEL